MVITGVVVDVATVASEFADVTDVTVHDPPPVPLAAAVIRPLESTVIFAVVYEPGVTAVFVSVVAKDPVPDPVMSHVSEIV